MSMDAMESWMETNLELGTATVLCRMAIVLGLGDHELEIHLEGTYEDTFRYEKDRDIDEQMEDILTDLTDSMVDVTVDSENFDIDWEDLRQRYPWLLDRDHMGPMYMDFIHALIEDEVREAIEDGDYDLYDPEIDSLF